MDYVDSHHQVTLQEAAIRYKQYIALIEDKLKKHQKPHNRKWKQGFIIPKKPLKCINIMETNEPQPIVYRSGWEKQFAEWCDSTDAIIRWGSEIIRILYKDPIKNKMSFYTPDFYIEYIDNEKKLRKVLIEIKPLKETTLKESSDGYDKLMVAKNSMKWASAIEYCKKRGIEFKVMHERNLGII
jgi:hypothetical protein